jgi:predicted NACHT family NTPase
MMAILNRHQELPRDRAELYNQASRVLLHQWDVERALIEDKRLDPKTIDYKDKQAMLRQVAYYMQTSEKGLAGNLISASDLEKILIQTDYLKSFDKPRDAARLMINQLRTRNFMLCFLGADYYAFVHRTFLEYFCAWEFVWQFKETQTLTIEGLKTEVFGKHWQDETWHEVLQLIAGMIEPKFADEIIEYLIKLDGEKEDFINLFLAVKCLVEVRNYRSVIPSTANNLVNLLKERAIADNDRDVRRAAVQALASNFKEHPDTLRLLKERAIADNDEYVRRAAVQALASNFKEHPDILPLLKERAIADNDKYVRRVALDALVSNFKDDPDTLPLLKERAIADNDGDVRYAALDALASKFKDDPDTLPLLKERAIADNDYFVRRAAVEALASNFKDEPGMFEVFYNCAVNDSFKRKEDYEDNPRQVALLAIIEQYPDHPQTLPLLRDKAENDADEKVREFAQNKLKELGEAK